MKYFLALTLAILFVSCTDEAEHNFTLKGHVKGLKKGTVYLQKQQDTMLTTLDSLEIKGDPNFELYANLDEPEVLFLKLDKNASEEEMVVFFADTGVTKINSTLKLFNFNAKIEGSKQQEVLENYMTTISKLNDRNLDLMKENFEANKGKDSTQASSFLDQQNNFVKRKYSYTINFALNNKDSEVAPYLAVYEVPNTTVRYLDTIYKTLDEPIKQSKYGKELKEIIERRIIQESN